MAWWDLDLNPTEHLCDELDHWLWARPLHPTSVPDITNTLFGLNRMNPYISCKKPSQKSGGCSCCKISSSSKWMAIYLKWDVQQADIGVRYPQMFGHTYISLYLPCAFKRSIEPHLQLCFILLTALLQPQTTITMTCISHECSSFMRLTFPSVLKSQFINGGFCCYGDEPY